MGTVEDLEHSAVVGSKSLHFCIDPWCFRVVHSIVVDSVSSMTLLVEADARVRKILIIYISLTYPLVVAALHPP